MKIWVGSRQNIRYRVPSRHPWPAPEVLLLNSNFNKPNLVITANIVYNKVLYNWKEEFLWHKKSN